ncbi:TetR/AcrR family transcriptional regulator [Lysobacter arvi]|uniref:TetR/AcrR family transcriptional regulator n=1 Tax=Lysobacter arvi TaxID=3038776 RepID=A0ABU1CA51_9GAMM|nr:TetR/AcrR family transcriptional regulator [Lysobacter arvi]MDR0182018.1 TetR/AcrR family transcriptional regulator [Lysobacter arvi]
MRSPTSRRTRRRPDDLRQQILDAAGELFLRDGYAKTSLDAVIERVGGSKRAIYSHFGGKEDLLAAMLTDISEQVLQALPEAADTTGADVRDSLIHFASAVMRALMDPRTVALYRLVIAEGVRRPELAEVFLRSGPRRAVTGLAQLLSRHAKAGSLVVADPTATAEHFIGMLRDDTYLEVLLGVRPPLSERAWKPRVARAVDIFLQGTAPPRAR